MPGRIGIGNADPILAADVLLLGSCIDARNRSPTATFRIGSTLWTGAKSWTVSITGPELVHLGCARARMPGVGVDLPNLDSGAEVHQEPSAVTVCFEEEILRRLIFLGWEPTVVQHRRTASVGVLLTIHNHELRLRGRIASCWRGTFANLNPAAAVSLSLCATTTLTSAREADANARTEAAMMRGFLIS